MASAWVRRTRRWPVARGEAPWAIPRPRAGSAICAEPHRFAVLEIPVVHSGDRYFLGLNVTVGVEAKGAEYAFARQAKELFAHLGARPVRCRDGVEQHVCGFVGTRDVDGEARRTVIPREPLRSGWERRE